MTTGTDDRLTKELLRRAHSPDTAATVFKKYVEDRPLFVKASSPERSARAKRQHEQLLKARAQRKSNKPRPLSAKRKRALNLNEIPKDQRQYSIYEPLHTLWCEYMRDILGLQSRQHVEANSVGPLLASADYHGAVLEVVRSRCPSRVGLQGIVVRETRSTFELITVRNELKTVPKEHTTFRFSVPRLDKEEPFVFEIVGNQFETRAADRSTKKFRLHLDGDT